MKAGRLQRQACQGRHSDACRASLGKVWWMRWVGIEIKTFTPLWGHCEGQFFLPTSSSARPGLYWACCSVLLPFPISHRYWSLINNFCTPDSSVCLPRSPNPCSTSSDFLEVRCWLMSLSFPEDPGLLIQAGPWAEALQTRGEVKGGLSRATKTSTAPDPREVAPSCIYTVSAPPRPRLPKASCYVFLVRAISAGGLCTSLCILLTCSLSVCPPPLPPAGELPLSLGRNIILVSGP